MVRFGWKQWFTARARLRRAGRDRKLNPYQARLHCEILEDRAVPSAIVFTDQSDYAPGATASISGSRFGANETVDLRVVQNGTTPVAQWQVTDDAHGNFQTPLTIGNWIGSTLVLTATGLSSGQAAQAAFTDSNVTIKFGGPVTPTPATFNLTYNLYANSTCSGTPTSSGTRTNVFSSGTTFPLLNSSQSVQVVPAATSNAGLPFVGWTTFQGNPFTLTPPRTLCVPGSNSGLTVNYTANYGLLVAADHASVTASQPQTLTNTGTYADPNLSDTDTLTASVGIVTQSGTSSGTWSWSLPTAAGTAGSNGTVTITLSDGTGRTARTSFSYIVSGGTVLVKYGGEANSIATFGLSDSLFASSGCTGTLNASGTQNVNSTGSSFHVGSSQSLELTAASLSNDGLPFLHWTSTSPFTTISSTSICVAGFGSGSQSYTAVYQPPVVTADHASVTVNEGRTAFNTGTFSDPVAGDTDTLTASIGTVTQSGTSSGTWSWSLPTVLTSSGTVTITAHNGNGGIGFTTFSLIVNSSTVIVQLAGGQNSIDSSSLTYSLFNTIDCSGTAVTSNTEPFSDEYGGAPAFPIGSSQSLLLTPATTSSAGFPFLNWSSSSPFTPSGPTSICVPGSGSGSQTYTANYGSLTVMANQTSVTITQGQTVTNTGTYSDSTVGANDTLTASIGTVTKTGTNSGTWTWSYGPPPNNIVQNQTVIITANNGTGGSTSTFFHLTVDNLIVQFAGPSSPPPANFNLTYTGYSGTNCTGTVLSSGTTTVDANGTAFPVGRPQEGQSPVGSGTSLTNSLLITAAPTSNNGASFVNWTSSSSFTGSGNTICVAGFNFGFETFMANYAGAVIQPTALMVAPASGSYGGTTTLTTTLTANGTPVGNEMVAFTLNNVNVGTATTNSNGVATLSGISLAGINAGTYAGYVGASFAGDSTYGPSTGTAALTVTPAPLTITADNQAKVYGQSNPLFTASFSGFVNGDTPAALGGMLNFSTPATSASSVGNYAITPSGLTSSNYTITFVNGTLSITPAPLAVTTNNATKVYGQANPPFSGTISGLLNGDNITATYTNPATTTSPVGAYAITPALSDNGTGALANYIVTSYPGTLTITPAVLTITADNQTMIYGSAVPPLTYTPTGFVNGDTSGVLSGSPSLSTTATSGSTVGSYPISIAAGSLNAANYTFAFINGTLMVNQATPTVAVTDTGGTYNGRPFSATATVTGVSGVAAGSLEGISPTLTYYAGPTATGTPLAGAPSAAGTYTVVASFPGSIDYTSASAQTTFVIAQAPLTVTAGNISMIYGAAVPEPTASYSGFVNGETPASLGGTLIMTTPATSRSPVGSYPIVPSGLTSSNYAMTFVNGTMTIMPSPLTVTANNATKVYGQANPPFSGTISGLLNGDTITATYSSPATTASPVGAYAITPALSDNGTGALANYIVTSNPGTLNVTPAPLTITANSTSKTYGQIVTFQGTEFTTSGLVNGDSVRSVTLTSSGAAATAAVAGSPYAIVPSAAQGSGLANYTISYVNGALIVNPAPLTVTANNASRYYGDANPTFTGTITGLQNGDNITATYSTTATLTSPVGTYAIVPTLIDSSPSKLGNYTVTRNNGTLTVIPAPITVTGRTITATAGAPFNGVVATFTDHDTLGTAGSYTVTIFWGDGNSSIGTVTATGPGSFTISGTNTYAAAGTYPITVQVTDVDSSTATGSSTAIVTSLGTPVQRDLTATIGFWNNDNGQDLINSFNGGSSSTALANWLAATFPNLYGVSAGSNNLTGKTNAQVAAYYQTLFNVMGPKVAAQVLDTALDIYATTTALGGTAAAQYGFIVSAYGLGAYSFNVGANGAAFGVANNSTLNIYQVLKAANQQAVNGVLYNGDQNLQNLAINVFDAINQGGDIG